MTFRNSKKLLLVAVNKSKYPNQTYDEPTFRLKSQDTGCIVEWEMDQDYVINFQWHAQAMNVCGKSCWIIFHLFVQEWYLLEYKIHLLISS